RRAGGVPGGAGHGGGASVNITSGSSVCGATAVTTFIEFYMPTSDVPLIEVEDGYDVDSISLTEKT
ncbi:unnamed protein product, partial [Heterosigma akashiwo]